MKKCILLIAACLFISFFQAQVKILFDATKAQTAGNADWIIDADNHNMTWNPNACINCGGGATNSNAQRFPTPAQSGVTASTPETYWEGALSNWGIDCAKKGYSVETLPYNVPITYGNASNVQDLSNYKVYIVDEPNIAFTASEKNAIVNFVKNGGSLFMISDHDQSDRNFDGIDSPSIWNDLMTTNTVQPNCFGISFDLQNFSQTSNNVIAASNDSIIHGPMGTVSQVQWANGTSMTLNTSQNSSVKGVVYKTGSSSSSTNVLCAYGRYQKGKFAAIGDSSPTDDGTGDPGDVLYNGYTADASGNHQKLLMNITIWLALGGQMTTGIDSYTKENERVNVFPNPAKDVLMFKANGTEIKDVFIYDNLGRKMQCDFSNGQVKIDEFSKGVYFLKILTSSGFKSQIFIKE